VQGDGWLGPHAAVPAAGGWKTATAAPPPPHTLRPTCHLCWCSTGLPFMSGKPSSCCCVTHEGRQGHRGRPPAAAAQQAGPSRTDGECGGAGGPWSVSPLYLFLVCDLPRTSERRPTEREALGLKRGPRPLSACVRRVQMHTSLEGRPRRPAGGIAKSKETAIRGARAKRPRQQVPCRPQVHRRSKNSKSPARAAHIRRARHGEAFQRYGEVET